MDQIILSGYGLLLLTGAYFGWKKGSKISLMMGAASGVLVLGAVFFLKSDPKCALTFLNFMSGFLSLTFLMRLIKTRKFMPSGMLFAVSLAVLIFCVVRWLAL